MKDYFKFMFIVGLIGVGLFLLFNLVFSPYSILIFDFPYSDGAVAAFLILSVSALVGHFMGEKKGISKTKIAFTGLFSGMISVVYFSLYSLSFNFLIALWLLFTMFIVGSIAAIVGEVTLKKFKN